MLRKVGSRVAGAIVGGVEGIGTGIVEAGSVSFSDAGNKASPIIFVISAPFFVIYHAGAGGYKGGKQGLAAGADYFNTVRNKRNAHEILEHLSKPQFFMFEEYTLLREEEEKIFLLHLEKMPTSSLKEKIQNEFRNYQSYVQTLKKYKTPIFITINNKTTIEEYKSFKEHVEKCTQDGHPISLEDKSHGKNYLKKENIHTTYPILITEFIEKVRKDLQKIYLKQGQALSRQAIMGDVQDNRPPAFNPSTKEFLRVFDIKEISPPVQVAQQNLQIEDIQPSAPPAPPEYFEQEAVPTASQHFSMPRSFMPQ